MATVSRLLAAWGDGEAGAFDELMPEVYGELSRIAAGYLRSERRGGTWETGALVHEALLRLLDQSPPEWKEQSHFYGLAALMMRRVLLDHGRRRKIGRRACERLEPVQAPRRKGFSLPGYLPLKDALEALAEVHPQAARVVELRFLWGFREEDVAERLGVSLPTVKRRWRMARAWLRRYLEPIPNP